MTPLIVAFSFVGYVIVGIVTTRVCRRYFPDTFGEGLYDSIHAWESCSAWPLVILGVILFFFWQPIEVLCTAEWKPLRKKPEVKDLSRGE